MCFNKSNSVGVVIVSVALLIALIFPLSSFDPVILSGKKVIVTGKVSDLILLTKKGMISSCLGASMGIGEQIAYYYAKNGKTLCLKRRVRILAFIGADVVVIARNTDKLDQVVRNCRKLGARSAFYISADLSKNKEIYYQKVVDNAVDLLNGLDTLILNHLSSNTTLELDGYYDKFDMNYVHWLFKVNAYSYFALAQAATKSLETRY